jgi:chemotaxis regulatin CheY-phosphate phosphatase CheZ
MMEEQIKNWSKLYGKAISEDEYKEICRNLDGFLSLLREWNEEESKNGNREHLPNT